MSRLHPLETNLWYLTFLKREQYSFLSGAGRANQSGLPVDPGILEDFQSAMNLNKGCHQIYVSIVSYTYTVFIWFHKKYWKAKKKRMRDDSKRYTYLTKSIKLLILSLIALVVWTSPFPWALSWKRDANRLYLESFDSPEFDFFPDTAEWKT